MDSDLDAKPRPENALPDEARDRIFVKSSEVRDDLPDRSVHLMVTSPPYNVGKEYDADLSMDDYLDLLKAVLGETPSALRVLEEIIPTNRRLASF